MVMKFKFYIMLMMLYWLMWWLIVNVIECIMVIVKVDMLVIMMMFMGGFCGLMFIGRCLDSLIGSLFLSMLGIVFIFV